MTFQEFQDTRVWTDNLASIIPDARWDDEPTPALGYVYCGSLYIEEVQAHWPEAARAQGRWYLILNNWEMITDDLRTLERHLYEYAQGEEIA